MPEPENCGRCKFGVPTKDKLNVDCHYHPPVPVLVGMATSAIARNPNEQPIPIVVAYPVSIRPDWWCHAFKPRTNGGG